MATDLKLNGGIEAGGAITAGGNIVGNVVSAVGNVQGVDGVFTGVVSAVGNVQGANGVFSNAISGATGSFSSSVGTLLAKITPEGGYAVKLTNKTGAASVKGSIVSLSTGTDNAFALAAIDASGVVGVVYEEGIDDGAECWVVVKGIAETLFTNNITHGMYARAPITADTDKVAGRAVGAAIPANTFNTDAYLARFGFVMESKDAGALAKVLLD
jgi:hypothetical protein